MLYAAGVKSTGKKKTQNFNMEWPLKGNKYIVEGPSPETALQFSWTRRRAVDNMSQKIFPG
jgi:hypothetical protein